MMAVNLTALSETRCFRRAHHGTFDGCPGVVHQSLKDADVTVSATTGSAIVAS